ncbi:ATP-binding protein [Egicoccus sp. AB-alg6-2]|uniref:PAS domain-containing sensor histidine kinase n=1 Tax=Egicoccus sp. AB-alg6-2 TaxID=3242692 RepID=UPI00359D54A0
MPDPSLDDAEAFAALRRSEERFQLFVESVTDHAIYLLGPTGLVESWNVGAQRLHGHLPDDVLGSHDAVFHAGDQLDADLPAHLLKTALAEGRAEHSGWRVRKDGSTFWADVVTTPLFDDAGEHSGFAQVVRDVTQGHQSAASRERLLEERGQALTRLEELDRWRRDFINTVVHDLQTPIIGISGFLDLLAAGDLPDDMKDDIHQRLRSNARTLQELISNLSSYTRLSEGCVVLRPARVPLATFVGRLLSDMTPVFGNRNVTCKVDDLVVEADPHGLERILRNLLGNAARHTPEGTAIAVCAEVDGDHVVVEVNDDGPGIPAELLARVFDRFERGDRGGTGLGLSIARQFVEMHGGRLTADSPRGAGATFRFTLPRAA